MADFIEDDILESIRVDVEEAGEQLRELALKIIGEGISEYPVFIASQEIVGIGKPIFDREAISLNWFFNVSILEDFVKRGIVSKERVKAFRNTYKDPAEKACIFILTPDVMQFVFIPYPAAGPDGADDEEEEDQDF
ncbi:MAG: hypothetical protein SF053_04345 [Bacteroidia bacterium]|nr:hypothetical protein [Bacteroidia bacterium]